MSSDKNLVVGRRKLDIEVTVDDVNRILEVGRILMSVLTQEELEDLKKILGNHTTGKNIGNAGVT